MSLRCRLGFHIWNYGSVQDPGKPRVPVRWCPRCCTYTFSRMGGKRYPLP